MGKESKKEQVERIFNKLAESGGNKGVIASSRSQILALIDSPKKKSSVAGKKSTTSSKTATGGTKKKATASTKKKVSGHSKK